MDIALLATINSNQKVSDAANLDVFKMAMNNCKQTGENTAEMIEAMDPNLGKNIDVRV
ncbi:YjfB family protein [Clostridium felsineum]|uniref:Uncharacterized protein n=1 Tax=Clostridium felsineum TaxID=36839 RepID=A0A1S8L8Z9_9CLOT|nr:YjfB family protein [Clostridium felsineum]URZ06294.1 hypothetical protein CLROS_016270 [Clostridium felsineum]URZ11329.1 hypothetical protein CROST_020460 [Clostridium felsineum]URZ15993.1 hypothetical protein CLFE_020400 [Clostridium felsineum DSM 794]